MVKSGNILANTPSSFNGTVLPQHGWCPRPSSFLPPCQASMGPCFLSTDGFGFGSFDTLLDQLQWDRASSARMVCTRMGITHDLRCFNGTVLPQHGWFGNDSLLDKVDESFNGTVLPQHGW